MSDLKWWLNDGLKSKKSLVREKPRATIKSDSSGYVWGAVMNNTDSGTSNSVSTHGMWRDDERKEHINVLELKAAMLAVQSLCRELTDCHVRIEIDNTTAVAYINSMGGTHSLKCNDISRQLITWCKARGIWLSACHIAGKDNAKADSYSRKQSIHTEWTLNKAMFKNLCQTFGTPVIDLFASRTNHQLSRYMSLYPDPNAEAINAFLHSWDEYVYIFPPFNLIPRVLKKLVEDQTERALIIVPMWTTQSWYPKLETMWKSQTIHLKLSKTLVFLPSDTKAIHPLYRKLRLTACILSGKK
ncbi:transposon ty3-i Gag-Pol polyprotein [Plakobranchus ocellatus]|uniref:Transposon ty3-i Gag-Pol polyprotein n=1 Tax=Plakobranchus ocellatus TaxID=259542 RepID=A0AAV3ZB23_9GAST|nr:transposon ty3-i Gag-Pol polyprotein [Plakobranchus ocellatus]